MKEWIEQLTYRLKIGDTDEHHKSTMLGLIAEIARLEADNATMQAVCEAAGELPTLRKGDVYLPSTIEQFIENLQQALQAWEKAKNEKT